MLAMVVLWTALPASACLLARHARSLPACCRSMKDCESAAMGADNACCQMHEGSAAVVSVLPYSNDDHAQQLIAMPLKIGVELPAAQGSVSSNAIATPPPKFPPGGAFSLRI